MVQRSASLVSLVFTSLLAAGICAAGSAGSRLEEAASGTRQWTGIGVSRSGRVFVNFPRWAPEVGVSVSELGKDGRLRPYPDLSWNHWDEKQDPALHFVCVQSVYVDLKDRLWILDPANPMFRGVVAGGAKLLQVDLDKDEVVRSYTFDAELVPAASYLNDVRIDIETETAYITDSGLGAIVVLDLQSGKARRVLADHPSTKAEPIEVVIEGKPFPFTVHADGIALDHKGGWLYYQALTGRTLYRVPTSSLNDSALRPTELAERVERFAASGVCDGLLYGPGGVYLTALEHGAIRRVNALGEVSTVVKDPRIRWPDSLALGPDGSVWIATSQIHLGPAPPSPYRILRLRPAGRSSRPVRGKENKTRRT